MARSNTTGTTRRQQRAAQEDENLQQTGGEEQLDDDDLDADLEEEIEEAEEEEVEEEEVEEEEEEEEAEEEEEEEEDEFDDEEDEEDYDPPVRTARRTVKKSVKKAAPKKAVRKALADLTDEIGGKTGRLIRNIPAFWKNGHQDAVEKITSAYDRLQPAAKRNLSLAHNMLISHIHNTGKVVNDLIKKKDRSELAFKKIFRLSTNIISFNMAMANPFADQQVALKAIEEVRTKMTWSSKSIPRLWWPRFATKIEARYEKELEKSRNARKSKVGQAKKVFRGKSDKKDKKPGA